MDDVDFSTGSVGLGVAITAFASIMQDYVARPRPGAAPAAPGRMVALVGDAELDEGNVYECLQEGWKHGLRNTWWIIDYNRQSLDGVVREGLWERIEAIFTAFGWRVVTLKYGALQRAAFEEPGGERLRQWIDDCPNQLYSALTFQGGAAWRKRLMDEIGDQAEVTSLIDRRTDAELVRTDEQSRRPLPRDAAARRSTRIDDDRPTVFLAYTIKGWGTPLAGHKDNHAGLMTKAADGRIPERHEVSGGSRSGSPLRPSGIAAALQAFLDAGAVLRQGSAPPSGCAHRNRRARSSSTMRDLSTQAGFGKILDAMAKTRYRRSPPHRDDLARCDGLDQSRPLGQPPRTCSRAKPRPTRSATRISRRRRNGPSRPQGQHIELGIAEMNLFLLLGAAGLSHSCSASG